MSINIRITYFTKLHYITNEIDRFREGKRRRNLGKSLLELKARRTFEGKN